ncbi:hypothetical protein Taro_030765 [Colocasia esculenta]|uniref:Myb/SANT-like domain-containing protein n=1 Tax=Colocasia esculenta TaxID=4460 RepID=A0A843VYV2_COLES|nr:hypothetical protein [Colocasia esculenta]
MVKAFNNHFRMAYTKDQLYRRFRILNMKFGLYEQLLKLSGWGCDDNKHVPIPGYEGAWEECMKVNPDFQLIKRKSFPLYKDMALLCGNTMATGDDAERSVRGTQIPQGIVPPNSAENMEISNVGFQTSIHTICSQGNQGHVPLVNGQQRSTTEGEEGTSNPKKPTSVNGRKERPKRLSDSAIRKFAVVLSDRNILFGSYHNDRLGQNETGADTYIPTLKEDIQILREIPTLPQKYVVIGYEGSAANIKVLRWAILKGGFRVPRGKYYLVDGRNMSFDEMDFTFFGIDELMIGAGKYLQFSPETWEFMTRAFNAITGVNYSISTMKHRMTFYKIVYYTVEDMVGNAGFAWDVDDCSVHGKNLHWNGYIVSNPSADCIRGKKFPWYEELTMATRGRRGAGPTRGDESAGGSQALAQQVQDQTDVPLPPPPPPVDYGALMQGLEQEPTHEAVFGGVPMMERFRRMTPPFFKGVCL